MMKRSIDWRKRIGRGLIGAFCLLLGYSAWSVYRYSLQDEVRMADAAIVLGAGAYRDRPSPMLRERINHAISLYEQGYVEYIIFTGGQGQRSWQGVEAEVSRNYALQQGVPAELLLMETSSTSTIANLKNAKQVADAHGLSSFIIVSTPFHMKRAMSMAREVGLEAYSSPTRTTQWISSVTQSYAYVREVAAYAAYLIRADGILRTIFRS